MRSTNVTYHQALSDGEFPGSGPASLLAAIAARGDGIGVTDIGFFIIEKSGFQD